MRRYWGTSLIGSRRTKPPPGSTGTTPAAPPRPGRHHTTTSRKPTHNNTKGSGLNKPPQNPGLDKQREGRCTRYGARHPIRRGALPTDRVHCPPRQAQLRTVPPDIPKRQHQTQPHHLEIPARLRTRGATPDPSRYTRSVARHPIRRGALPTDRVQCSESQEQTRNL